MVGESTYIIISNTKTQLNARRPRTEFIGVLLF